jgi:hypothetical protein
MLVPSSPQIELERKAPRVRLRAMVKERYPELAALSLDDKWLLMTELEDEVMASDASTEEPLKSEIAAKLEERYQDYLRDPDTASA